MRTEKVEDKNGAYEYGYILKAEKGRIWNNCLFCNKELDLKVFPYWFCPTRKRVICNDCRADSKNICSTKENHIDLRIIEYVEEEPRNRDKLICDRCGNTIYHKKNLKEIQCVCGNIIKLKKKESMEVDQNGERKT